MQYSDTKTMFRAMKVATIRVSDLSAVPDIEATAREFLVAPVPALKNTNAMSVSAVHIGAVLHMPVVWRPDPDKRLCRVLANLRTAEICRAQLPPTEKISVLLLSGPPEKTSIREFLALAGFISSIWHGLDPVVSGNILQRQASLIHPSLMERFFPELTTRAGRERLLGQNRRHSIPERMQAASPTSQVALNLDEESDND